LGEAAALGSARARLHGAPPGHVARGTRQRAARRPHAPPLPRRSRA
jgi:hypothetical protein